MGDGKKRRIGRREGKNRRDEDRRGRGEEDRRVGKEEKSII